MYMKVLIKIFSVCIGHLLLLRLGIDDKEVTHRGGGNVRTLHKEGVLALYAPIYRILLVSMLAYYCLYCMRTTDVIRKRQCNTRVWVCIM